MTNAPYLRQVATWLKQLAELVSPGKEPITKDKLATYASFLAADFPPQVFTTTTVQVCALKCEYWPSLKTLHGHLHDWWKDHRPPPTAHLLTHAKSSADDIARQATNRASWNDATAIRASVRLVLSSPVKQDELGKLLGKAVWTNAPHHLHHVPPQWHPAEEAAA